MTYRAIMLFVLLLHSFSTIAQNREPDKELYDKYFYQSRSMYDYIKIAEESGWVPTKEGMYKGAFKTFEDAFIKVCKGNDKVLASMKAEGCYYCALDNEYLFQRYNRTYKVVSKEYWMENCPVLYLLMSTDK